MERRPSPSTPLLAVVLLLLAPLLLARELGADACGSYEQHVRSPLTLPATASDGDGAVVPPELGALLPGVSRPGGRAPPAPKPSYGPQPLREPSSPHGLGSPRGVSGRQGLAPPSPEGKAPPHYRRSGPAAADVLDALRVFRDALVRYVVGALVR
ncbi:hypothetical protein PAHAL_3G194500 [Panicum hallii]|uniref:Uncharacterized protein n=1 Tax=Panicum hallii TaxID=206008 RepID=A0A2S3HAB2_9POAL|nr:formin-like protein 18 [Panicum hallii]PAN18323.1 hypothetical protein PAHAL_3G194500 [Panicum hallii]